MTRFEIAERYARAFHNLEATQEQMDRRNEILAEMATLWKTDPQVHQFFLTPEIAREKKQELLEKAISDHPLVDFLLLLMDKGKLAFLPEIAAKYQRLVAFFSGRFLATLVTAKPLDAHLRAKLIEDLEKKYAKTVILEETIDPKLIGGAILQFENQLADFSVKSRLENIKRNLLRKKNAQT